MATRFPKRKPNPSKLSTLVNIKNKSSSEYQLRALDSDRYLRMLTANSILKVPMSNDVEFEMGSIITIRYMATSGVLSISGNPGVTINSESLILTSKQCAQLIYIGKNVWDLI